MNQNTILIAVITLLIGGIGGYVIADKDKSEVDEYNCPMMMSDYKTSENMPMGSMSGMDHSAMMVESEREFVAGMIPHHQEAVDTASEVLARGGTTEEMRTLAEDIVAAQ